jgi:hypothetical protein
MHHSFLAVPPGAGRLPRDENGVCHRQIRGGMTVEGELLVHDPRVHPRGRRPLVRDRNSVNASATVAEIVIPERAACLRTRTTSGAGSFTVNTTLCSGTARRPVDDAWST